MAKKDNSKTIAILSYVTIIGWIIALVMHQSEKTKLGGFHIRQTLMLYIAAVIGNFVPVIGWAVHIAVFILWVIGLIGAINEEMKPVPVLGDLAQQWFKGL